MNKLWRYGLIAASVMTAVECSYAATMDYQGTWSNTATYTTGRVVIYNKGIYYSLKSTTSAPNRNYIPSSNTSWWAHIGTVGNTIHSGVVNPTSSSLGQVGDFYINTQTNTIFGPKLATTPFWPLIGVSLIGKKGDVGPAGAIGPQVPSGNRGATGAVGATGAIGPVGPSGAIGAVGAVGPQGPAGPKGDQANLPKVVDANGTFVGILTGRDVLIDVQDGQVRLFDIQDDNYDAESEYLYTTSDCSGTKYMYAGGIVRDGVVLNSAGQAHETPYQSLLSGKLTYAKTPFTYIDVQSTQVLGSWESTDCQETTSATFTGIDGSLVKVGIATSVNVDWIAPLRVVFTGSDQ
jgi:hypothetical protein